MSDWKTLSSEVVYETPWIKVHRDQVRNQNDTSLTYSYVALQHGSVFIVAVNEKGKIWLQSVYRYPIDQRLWEIPAGYMEDGETPLVTAQRELQEEAALASDDWQDLGTIFQIAGTGRVPCHIFMARNVRRQGGQTDEDEDIKNAKFVSLSDIEKMIKSGELVDSPVIASVYMAKIAGLL